MMKTSMKEIRMFSDLKAQTKRVRQGIRLTETTIDLATARAMCEVKVPIPRPNTFTSNALIPVEHGNRKRWRRDCILHSVRSTSRLMAKTHLDTSTIKVVMVHTAEISIHISISISGLFHLLTDPNSNKDIHHLPIFSHNLNIRIINDPHCSKIHTTRTAILSSSSFHSPRTNIILTSSLHLTPTCIHRTSH